MATSGPTDKMSSENISDRSDSERRRASAILELVFAGALWGFGFIAAIWMLQTMGPLMATGVRFLAASVVGLVIVALIPSLRRSATLDQFKLAALPGLFLTLTLVLQTWGLRYTTATKSGFITILYVLIVPILERVWLHRRLPRFHFLYVILALIGVALICDLPGALTGKTVAETFGMTETAATSTLAGSSAATSSDPAAAAALAASRWNFGDFLTLLCAICASLQIVWFAFIHKRIGSSFVFNVFQTIWAMVPPALLALALEPLPSFPLTGKPLTGLLMLSFGSTLIAFSLQVRAQKTISPSLASLLFLLESPFAALFAVYFLGEHLRTDQWIGAGLIMSALVMSTIVGVEEKQEEVF